MRQDNQKARGSKFLQKMRQFYSKEYHLAQHRRHIENERFFRFLSYLAGKKYWEYLKNCCSVLEVGCGIGQNIYGHPEAMGIDISQFAVDMCKARGIKARLMAVEELRFSANTFDGIICAHVLEHLENPLDSLRTFYNIMKPKGKIALSIPLSNAKSSKTDRHLYCWNLMEISNLLERAGLKVVNHVVSAIRFKYITCHLPFSIAYILSRYMGYILRFIRFKPGVNELIIYAIKPE